jgi:hypothetical protein
MYPSSFPWILTAACTCSQASPSMHPSAATYFLACRAPSPLHQETIGMQSQEIGVKATRRMHLALRSGFAHPHRPNLSQVDENLECPRRFWRGAFKCTPLRPARAVFER